MPKKGSKSSTLDKAQKASTQEKVDSETMPEELIKSLTKPLSDIEMKILESFVQLSYQHGAHQVSYQMLADSTGLGYTTIHYHFPTKTTDIYQRALVYMFQEAYQFIDKEMLKEQMKGNGYNPIFDYIKVMFTWVRTKSAHASFLCYFYYLMTSKAQIVINNSFFLSRAYLRLESYLHESMGRKLIPEVQKVSEIVPKLHSVITGCALIAGISRDDKIINREEQNCSDIVKTILKINH